MSGPIAAAGSARVRIKGRRLSVMCFLLISVAYTLPWIVMLSQLAYYSRAFGPQVLLQLNIAFYLPSIPTLLVMGHVERVLEEWAGAATSMAVRLFVGLAGCAALSAAYPFVPPRLGCLLWVVVGQGCFSAVAFSTSYQLVAWFRSADTIALGIGCVASGPLALVLQVALQIGTTPRRWQWIALFEAAAGVVVLGSVAAASLLGQYWGVLSGAEEYDEATGARVPAGGADRAHSLRAPLLPHEAAERRADDEAADTALLLSRMLTLQDPFQGFPYTTVAPSLALPHAHAVVSLMRRAHSDDFSDFARRQTAAATVMAAAAAAAAAAGGGELPSPSSPRHLPSRSRSGGASRARRSAPAFAQQGDDSDGSGGGGEGGGGGGGGGGGAAFAAAVAAAKHALASPSPAAAWVAAHHAGGGGGGGDLEAGTAAGSSSRGGSPAPQGGAAAGSLCAGSGGSYVPELLSFPAHIYGGGGSGGDGDADAAGVGGASAPVASSALASAVAEELPPLWAPNASRAAAAAARGGGPSSSGDSSDEEGDEEADVELGGGSGSGDEQPHGVCAVGASEEQRRRQQQQQGKRRPRRSSRLRPPDGGAPASAAATHGKPPLPFAAPTPQTTPRTTPAKNLLQQQQQREQSPHHRRTGSGASTASAAPSAFSAAQREALSAAGGSDAALGSPRTAAAAAAANQQYKAAMTATTATTAPSSVATAGGGGGGEGGEGRGVVADYWEVFGYTWTVVLAALSMSTLLNCVFPFFTYVESSGLLGEFLPQVMFYTRMLADITGRMLPRRKALAITSPGALLALSGGVLLLSAGFFAYLRAPPRLQHDPYALLLVLALWLGGGYINTMSYILAPSLVPPRVCTKAGALMALTYQVAHLAGLACAIALALAWFGDVSGGL